MILPAILKRKSVRKFKKDPILASQIIEIIKAGEFAPSAKNNHAIKYLVIKNQKIKDKLAEILFQPFVKSAPVLIVPYLEFGKSILPIQDLSVASENMLLQIAEMGLGAVWKNVGIDLADQVKKILKIDKSCVVINLIPIGYANENIFPHADNNFQKEKVTWI